MQISKREGISKSKAMLIRLIAIVVALIICAIVIFLIVNLNPIKVYISMFNGAFGTNKRMWVTLRDMSMLTCIAIGLAPAFKMRFWNIGAEGQMLVGAISAAYFMITFSGRMNPIILMICMIIGSLAMGAIWGLIPGFFKAKWNTNETLFTLMMNYIAIQCTSFCVSLWENPPGSNSVGTINATGANKYVGWIGNLLSKGYNKDYGILLLITIFLAIFVYIYLKYTKHGFEIAVVGDSENTARYAGIRVDKVYIRTMALSGALCGLAGFLAVSSVSHTISTDTANGRGFTAIIVAWLAKMNPFIMIIISLLLAFLDKGSVQIASEFGLNEYVSKIITGIILLFILGSEFFINYQVSFKKIKKDGGK
ncbi:MAG: ABC transporter permease [Eubacteriales bacterium]|nr:ABC transporter permease [Eubacteriales bacterium]